MAPSFMRGSDLQPPCNPSMMTAGFDRHVPRIVVFRITSSEIGRQCFCALHIQLQRMRSNAERTMHAADVLAPDDRINGRRIDRDWRLEIELGVVIHQVPMINENMAVYLESELKRFKKTDVHQGIVG